MMESGYSQAQVGAKNVTGPSMGDAITSFDPCLVRVSQLGDRIGQLADKMAGGRPREAGVAGAPVPDGGPHVHRLQSKRNALSRLLDIVEQETDRLAQSIEG
jgi:hypothetical protein